MITELESKARNYACEKHIETNHKYGELPYTAHLCHARDVADRYLVDAYANDYLLAAVWAHDLIEDCRVTYNDLSKVCGTTVAEIVYAVTQPKGRNRKERNSLQYYSDIRNVPGAAFVKLCDRIANVEHGINSGIGMFQLYQKEHVQFKAQLEVVPGNEPMWQYLNELLQSP